MFTILHKYIVNYGNRVVMQLHKLSSQWTDERYRTEVAHTVYVLFYTTWDGTYISVALRKSLRGILMGENIVLTLYTKRYLLLQIHVYSCNNLPHWGCGIWDKVMKLAFEIVVVLWVLRVVVVAVIGIVIQAVSLEGLVVIIMVYVPTVGVKVEE